MPLDDQLKNEEAVTPSIEDVDLEEIAAIPCLTINKMAQYLQEKFPNEEILTGKNKRTINCEGLVNDTYAVLNQILPPDIWHTNDGMVVYKDGMSGVGVTAIIRPL